MVRANWMADALRAGGLQVDESRVPDWRNRGHDEYNAITHVMAHHTAGAANGDYPSLQIVRDGRPDLRGPLSNLGLSRSGVWIPIASGVTWHAGPGQYQGLPNNNANYYALGIEAESVGTRDDWTPAQREAYPRGVAALLKHMGKPAANVIGHKEWATPRGRKIDPANWDMNVFRADVARYMNGVGAAPAAVAVAGAQGALYTVRKGDSLGVIARQFGVTVQQLTAWNNIADPNRIAVGQVLRTKANHPPVLGFSLPSGHYYGNIAGPAKSHGGASAAERDAVRAVQQWLIYHGCVSGVSASAWESSGWADGVWEDATDTACRIWHDRFYPGQPEPEQVWADDYLRLTRP